MKVGAAVALMVIGGCWREPEPAAPRSPEWPLGTSTKRPPPPLSSRPQQRYTKLDLVKLEHDLRDTPAEVILGMGGPVVVADLDTSAIDTLCGDQVTASAPRWISMLADPARQAPTCSLNANDTFWCTQFDGSSTPNALMLLFTNDGHLDLKSVTSGTLSWASVRSIGQSLRRQVANATCP